MNGEVKSYRLNEPMSWKEFKDLPDDIKVVYIKALRQKFNVPGKYIAVMMGVNACYYSKEINRLGISEGKNCRGRCTPWDKEGWLAWRNGAPVPACSAESVEESFVEDAENVLPSLEDICEPVPVPEVKVLPVREEKTKATPYSIGLNYEDEYNRLREEFEKMKAENCYLNEELKQSQKELSWLYGFKAAVGVIFGKDE